MSSSSNSFTPVAVSFLAIAALVGIIDLLLNIFGDFA